MKLLKIDLSGIARALLGSSPKSASDFAFVKIIVQVIRAAK